MKYLAFFSSCFFTAIGWTEAVFSLEGCIGVEIIYRMAEHASPTCHGRMIPHIFVSDFYLVFVFTFASFMPDFDVFAY